MQLNVTQYFVTFGGAFVQTDQWSSLANEFVFDLVQLFDVHFFDFNIKETVFDSSAKNEMLHLKQDWLH